MPRNIQDIKVGVQKRWGDDPAVLLCMKVFDFVENDPEQANFLSVRNIMNICKEYDVSVNLLKALNILSMSEFYIFNRSYLYIDSAGNEFDISLSDYNEAEKNGGLVHPETGNIIENYQDSTYIYFSISSDLTLSNGIIK